MKCRVRFHVKWSFSLKENLNLFRNSLSSFNSFNCHDIFVSHKSAWFLWCCLRLYWSCSLQFINNFKAFFCGLHPLTHPNTLPSSLEFPFTPFLYPPPSSTTYPPLPPSSSSSFLSYILIRSLSVHVCVCVSLVLLWSMRSTWWPDRHPHPLRFFVVFFLPASSITSCSALSGLAS